MPSTSRHLNYYGFLALFVCLMTIAGFFILRDANCNILTQKNYDKLEPIQIAGAVTGGVLFLLSFFNIANILWDIKIVFFVVIVAILVMSGIMFWAAYIAFVEPCVSGFGFNTSLFSRNAFEAEDGHNIAVFILDLLAGLMLLSIGATFAKRL